jgi:hypothetical protein
MLFLPLQINALRVKYYKKMGTDFKKNMLTLLGFPQNQHILKNKYILFISRFLLGKKWLNLQFEYFQPDRLE